MLEHLYRDPVKNPPAGTIKPLNFPLLSEKLMADETQNSYEYFAAYLPAQLAFAFERAWKYKGSEYPSADLADAEW